MDLSEPAWQLQGSEDDSGIDTSYSSGMESVSSSNYQFRFKGSRRLEATSSDRAYTRRYHGLDHNPYPFPNDDEEFARLDKLHFLMKLVYGRNVLAPVSKNATCILDVGTGSGCFKNWPYSNSIQGSGQLKWLMSTSRLGLLEWIYLLFNQFLFR